MSDFSAAFLPSAFFGFGTGRSSLAYRQVDCDAIQGHFIAEPGTLAEVRRLVTVRNLSERL